MLKLNKQNLQIQKKLLNIVYSQFSSLPTFATVDPDTMSEQQPGIGQNLVNGEWKNLNNKQDILDPLSGQKFLQIPNTQNQEDLVQFKNSAQMCPKYGLHNPLRNVDRYNLYGDIIFKTAAKLREPEIEEYFTKLIQRVMPKSYIQAKNEVVVTRKFLENFGGDNVRYCVQGFHVSGDHDGQQSNGYRWPFGHVMVISPFNFPLEIPTLQLVGALMVGNKATLKPDPKVGIVMEQFIRLMIECGAPKTDLDLLYADGQSTEQLIKMTNYRCIQFTGSSKVGEKLALLTQGKIRLEDAGFDWKILGPDVQNVDYVTYVCDQDAYAISGQKCSAQSILFIHENWLEHGIYEKLKNQAQRRNLEDFSIVPVLSWNNNQIQDHIQQILKIEGSKILFGGNPMKNGNTPSCYGLFEPTAIYVPIQQIIKPENMPIVCKELFGPFQIITDYKQNQLDIVLDILDKQDAHLTAGIVSNDVKFTNQILGKTCNGTQYVGLRARTTGAPQNHWFGPSGDPRGTGIGTKEGILQTWTAHREIITDTNTLPKDWVMPKPN